MATLGINVCLLRHLSLKDMGDEGERQPCRYPPVPRLQFLVRCGFPPPLVSSEPEDFPLTFLSLNNCQ